MANIEDLKARIEAEARREEFSIDKARRELGYAPEYDIQRGIAEGVRWYLESKKGKQEEVKQAQPLL